MAQIHSSHSSATPFQATRPDPAVQVHLSPSLLIVGGGLAGGLLAWRLAECFPDLSLQVLEQKPSIGAEHTWCFHQHDLTPESLAWLSPLISASWTSHDVRFPGLNRHLRSAYFAIRSEDFYARLKAKLGQQMQTGVQISSLAADRVVLANGDQLSGTVLDARGAPALKPGTTGWQKFVGLELETEHGLRRPVLMDATVPQLDGFRFMYLLPWSPRRLLIEDTRYSDTPELDTDTLEAGILAYAKQHGWHGKILRREQGCLPLPLQSGFLNATSDLPALGLRTGMFHYVTGYSLPETLRWINQLVEQAKWHDWQPDALSRMMTRYQSAWQGRQHFLILLNRLLFRAADPEQRWRVLARFYGLPEPLIRRFYAGQLTPLDQFRLLAGRPPVSVFRALTALPQRRLR
ncbi:MAG: lycopene cyclase [Candidatus Melainabacteria bacterium HGW-Melainabacteria-1]|nr:MAG: lycopene cyclase [Candidatus Melainabacteria bacterium HGW-Melainabacteria-1]